MRYRITYKAEYKNELSSYMDDNNIWHSRIRCITQFLGGVPLIYDEFVTFANELQKLIFFLLFSDKLTNYEKLMDIS